MLLAGCFLVVDVISQKDAVTSRVSVDQQTAVC